MASNPTGFLDFEIVGNERGVQNMLEQLDSALSPVGLAAFLHGSVEPWIQQRAANRFANEGDDVSGKWAPLAEATIEIREHAGFGGSHPINKRTGELEEYITQGSFDIQALPTMATLKYPKDPPKSGHLREKVKTAQKGKASPSTVARPVLGMNERDLTHVLTTLAFFIQRGGLHAGTR